MDGICAADRSKSYNDMQRQFSSSQSPDFDAALLIGFNSVAQHPSAELSASLDLCGTARAEGITAGILAAVRTHGADYTNAVYQSVENKGFPTLASQLREATIEPSGRSIFR
jgi:hypothetical protein